MANNWTDYIDKYKYTLAEVLVWWSKLILKYFDFHLNIRCCWVVMKQTQGHPKFPSSLFLPVNPSSHPSSCTVSQNNMSGSILKVYLCFLWFSPRSVRREERTTRKLDSISFDCCRKIWDMLSILYGLFVCRLCKIMASYGFYNCLHFIISFQF